MRSGAGLALMAALSLQGASEVGAQERYAARAEAHREHATVAAASIRLPAGSGHDQEGFEGAGVLVARTLAAQANEALAGTQARVDVRVGRAATTFTLSAAPETWPTALGTLEAVLFRERLSERLFEEERAALARQLAFRGGSPVADFEREWVQMIGGAAAPWARPSEGTTQSVGALSPHHAELFRGNAYATAAATLAVVSGPTATPDTASVDATMPVEVEGATTQEPVVAWTAGSRTEIVQEVTSAWIAVAYPAPSSLPRTTLELVAHLVGEALNPVPPDPDRYGVEARIIDTPGGPVLLVEAAVLPEAGDRWEALVTERVASLRDAPPTGELFRWSRRRFRARRLLEDAAPAAAAARIAEDLARDGRPRRLLEEIDALTVERLAAALRSLGPTRIFRLGPDLGAPGR